MTSQQVRMTIRHTRLENVDLRAEREAIAVASPRYGSRRIAQEVRRSGWQVHRKRLQRLMHEENLVVQVQRYCRTTNSELGFGRYPNLVKHLSIVRPNQVRCAKLFRLDLHPLATAVCVSGRGARHLSPQHSWGGAVRQHARSSAQEMRAIMFQSSSPTNERCNRRQAQSASCLPLLDTMREPPS